MPSNDDVGQTLHPEQGGVLDGRAGSVVEEELALVLVDVQAGRPDLATLQGINEGGGVWEVRRQSPIRPPRLVLIRVVPRFILPSESLLIMCFVEGSSGTWREMKSASL